MQPAYYHSYHHGGLVHLLAGWLVHAAIFRLFWRLPTPVVFAVGLVALVVFVVTWRGRSNARHR
jgi:hypothetical protein